MIDYVELHRHSDASSLDGAGTSFQFAARAAELGQPYLAQTDHGNMNGALKHLKACEQHGIIPIQGVEAYWRPDRHVRGAGWQYRRWHLILLAISLKGWHNLIKITSAAFIDGFYQNPCVDWELLERYQEDLVCTASCALGPVAFLLENGTDRVVDEFITKALDIFGERFFVELMPHDWDRQRALNLELVSLANRRGFGYYATVDSHYVLADWADTQKIITLIGTNTTVAEAAAENEARLARGDEIYELGHEGLHLMDGAEVRERFQRFHPDLGDQVIDRAIATTMDVARMVKPYLTDRAIKMPRLPAGTDPEQELIAWCREGMVRINQVGNARYEEQLEYELSVIRARNNFSYMWIVGDLVRWAKSDEPLPATPDDPDPPRKHPIRLGPGRGSAAGSLVCYLAGITGLDPIAHKLKFERFMNPGRKGIPDIDLDFASVKIDGYNRRPECKEYLIRKHGRNAVADVVSYSTFQPRAAIKDVARILGVDYARTEAVVKLIDPVHDQDLTELATRMAPLAAWAADFPVAWKHAVRLENAGDALTSRMSKHPGGVIVVPGEVVDFMPIVRSAEGDTGYRTGWSETPQISICDEFGLLKIDILGLAGIARQQMALDSIYELTGEMVDLEALPPLADPYDVDPEVMQVFQDGHTLGLNQFGGGNITSFLRQLRPENLVDLAAANALFRPGPIGGGAPWIFAKRKNGEELWEPIPELNSVFGDTYGVMPFQETVMELFQTILGYSAGEADDVRKEIDKLNRAHSQEGRRRLGARKDAFIEAATKLFGEEVAERLWTEVLPFTGYSFNRAHATGYAVQAYQDAWLKRYHPTHFYAALLTTTDDLALSATREARFFDVSVLPPDINLSKPGFTVDHTRNALRYGLSSVKGVGDVASLQVMADRPFANLEDFETRSSRKYSKVTKASREKLLQVGALDCFGARTEWGSIARARAEMDLLGVALEPGGLLGVEDSALVWANLYSEQEVDEAPEDSPIIVGGTVTEQRITTVKRGRDTGREMAFLRLSLDLDSWSLTCFPGAWAAMRDLVAAGEMVMVKGHKDDRGSIIANSMMPMAQFLAEKHGVPYIQLLQAA